MQLFFLFLLLSWLAGIALGQWATPSVGILVALTVALIGLRLRLSAPLLIAGVALLALGSVYGTPAAPSDAACAVTLPTPGIIVGTPRLLADRAQYVMEDSRGCRSQVTTARFPVYVVGEVLRLEQGKVTPVAALSNQGYAGYLQRQGIGATISYPTITRLSEAKKTSSATRAIERVIKTVFVEPDAGMALALLLANTAELPEALKENFRATGLSHLLAISGMNISLLAGLLIGLLYLIPLSPLSRTLVLAVILWAYMALLNWPVSAVRATFFWTIALLALRVHLLVSLPTVLLLTLLVLLSFNPLLVTDVSFQLSVAAVAGIFLMLFLVKRRLQRAPTWVKVTAGTLLVTLGATLTTWPIIAYHFGTISLLSLPANLLVAPLVLVQMVSAIAAVLIGFISPALALLPAYVFHLTVAWMGIVSSALAQLSAAYLQHISLSPAIIVFYYLALAATCYWWLRHQRRSWQEVWV